jgi:O-antigen/teichoic acid export membrane protein
VKLGKLAGFALGPIGTAAVSLVTVPAIAWFFSPDDVGRVAMLQVGISFSLLFFSLGLDQAYVREYHGTAHPAALFKACLWPGLLVLLAVAVLQIMVPQALSMALFAEPDDRYSALAALCIVAAFITRFLSLILRMQERGLAFSLSQLLPKIGFLLVIGGIVLLAHQHNLLQLLAAHTVAITGTTLALAWNTRNEWRPRTPPLPATQRRELLKFGLPLVMGGLAFWGMTSLDRLFLRHFADFEALGLYAVCTSFAGAATILQSIFSTLWAPAAYRRHSAGEPPAAIQRATDHVLAAVVFLFATGGLLSWGLTFVLPARYHDSQHILLACLAYPLLYTLGEASGIGLGIARKSGMAMAAMAVALCVNIALNAWLVPLRGAAGAASATALSFYVLLVLRTELAARCWVPAARVQLYAFAGGCTLLAVAHALAGPQFPHTFTLLWGIVFLVAAISFRSSLKQLVNWLRSARRPTPCPERSPTYGP